MLEEYHLHPLREVSTFVIRLEENWYFGKAVASER